MFKHILKYLFVLDCERYIQRYILYQNIICNKPILSQQDYNELIEPIPRLLQQSSFQPLSFNFHINYFETLFLHTLVIFTITIPFLYYSPILVIFIPILYLFLCFILNIIITYIEISQTKKLLKQCYDYYQDQ